MIMNIRMIMPLFVGAASSNTENAVLVAAVLLITVAFAAVLLAFALKPRWLIQKVDGLKRLLIWLFRRKAVNSRALEEALEDTGFTYDPQQDIFYSIKDAWQREFGYCRLYDEAAAPSGMILDSDPVYFEYGSKRWLIEFWKGQYDLTCGAEIGVFSTDIPDLDIPGLFSGTFYQSVDDNNMLYLTMSLKKNGYTLFTRQEKQWWLTGFKLGEFSEPSELTLYLSVTLKNHEMRDAFIGGLNNAGYDSNEYAVHDNTVSLTFQTPHSRQPLTRIPATDHLIQMKNRLMCEEYQKITRAAQDMPSKYRLIRRKSPAMLNEIFNFGKTKQINEIFKTIQKYL